MNKVILIGRLTKDPEVRFSQSAEPIAVAKFSLAVKRRFSKQGEPDADFINCVAFRKQAEFIEKYFKKGMQMAVTGSLKIDVLEGRDGQRRWFTDVVIDEVEFTESRSAYETRQSQTGNSYYDSMAEQYSPPPMSDFAPDIPRSMPSNQGSGEAAHAVAKGPYEPESFSAITESIDDDDDLPF